MSTKSAVLKEGNVKMLSTGLGLHRSRPRIMVLSEGLLQWFSPGRGGGRGREKGRIALDTLIGVRRCVKKNAQTAFELAVGSEPGRPARLVVPLKGDEMVLNLQMRRVFEAESVEERDAWVSAIALARRRAHPDDTSHSSSGSSSSLDENDSKSPRSLRSEVEAPLRACMVTVRGGTGEVVAWRGHGDTTNAHPHVSLGPLTKADAVCVWVDWSTHAYVSGDTLAQALHDHDTLNVPLSGGRGVLVCRFLVDTPPPSWYTQPTVLATVTATLLSWVVLPFVASLGLCVLWLMWVMQALEGARQELGHVRMHIHALQPPSPSSEASVESNGPLLSCPRPVFPNTPYEVPSLFLSGCVGNVAEATRKWQHAYKWRQAFNIPQILDRPHPLFFTLMQQWPQIYLPNARNGDAVFLDKLGPSRIASLLELGISAEDLMHHMAFIIEFSLKHQRRDPSKHLQLCIHDLDGVGFNHIDPRGIAYLRRLTSLWQQFYVGHERAVLLINAPPIFPILWNVARRFVNQTKRRNIYVANKGKDTLALLSRFMDLNDIPQEYGGRLPLPSPIEESAHLLPHQSRLLRHMEALQRAHPDAQAHMPIA